MKRVLLALAFWSLVCGVAAVMAAPAPDSVNPPSVPSWLEHWDLAQVVIVLLFGLALWMLRNKLERIDNKFDKLFKWRDEISGRVARLEGEHGAMKSTCAARRGES